MSFRTAGWLARGMWVLTVPATALTLFLVSLNEPSSSFWDMALTSLLILAFSTVGTLVVTRRPGNSIGWLFCSGAFIWILGELALEYGVYTLITSPGALPAAEWMVWFGGWARGMGWFLIVVFLLLLFPTGRLPSPRWRPVLWGAVGFVALFTLVSWLSPVSDDFRLAFVRNPLGLELETVELLGEVLYLVLPLVLVASGAAVIVRFRRSSGQERQQIKWFAYAVAVMIVLFVIWFSLILAGFTLPGALVFVVPLLGLPVAVGIAILKYRLYDIDVLINRTLVYGLLTAALALIYFGGVVLLQYALRALTGQESQLAIVASTLLIAALFNPLRKHIQAFIDRRFYRKKYDAAKTLEAFSARLRKETDLNHLTNELVGVVRETMQPAHVSLWLRTPEQGRSVEEQGR
ncbi:MAG TPA: hypothetical protein VFE21_06685 [Rubrobacteraceae bacterium]|nr:hypothetical protein [Rubrobacteraceae bacterium]